MLQRFIACLLLSMLLLPAVQASNLVQRSKRDLLSGGGLASLNSADRELAEQLEIMSLLNELYDPNARLSPERKNRLLHQVRESILEGFLDVESVRAEAQNEQDALKDLLQTLMNKRDRKLELNNATNFIASGTLNTVGSVLGFGTQLPPFPGNVNQMLSGVVSTSMSTYALKQSKGGTARREGAPTVIAELFGRPTDEETAYPESVWRFLHGHFRAHPEKTRIEVLEERWLTQHRLETPGSRRERQKIDMLCGVASATSKMTINDLSDEIAMINDISTLVSLMAHHLRNLMRLVDSDVIEAVQ